MNAKSWSVCIIEPNKFERQIIIDLLRNAGADKIKAFADAETATVVLESFAANIIIASFEMAPLDGAAWTRALRRNRALLSRKAAVFITSGAFSRSMAEECRHAGANALIGKPLSAKVLTATIAKVLANPRPFIDAEGYVGPCRRAGIVTAGAPKKRRKADDSASEQKSVQTLGQVVEALSAATAQFAEDVRHADGCEAALRMVQAYAVNASDQPLMRACAAFAAQIKTSRTARTDATRAALEACARGVAELAATDVTKSQNRETIADTVRETVAKAALQRAA